MDLVIGWVSMDLVIGFGQWIWSLINGIDH